MEGADGDVRENGSCGPLIFIIITINIIIIIIIVAWTLSPAHYAGDPGRATVSMNMYTSRR